MTTEVRKLIPAERRGYPVRWLWRLTLCIWLVGQLAIVESSWTAEAALLVIRIEIDGRAVDTVSDVAIIASGQDRAQMRKLSIGARVEQGAEIVAPRRTVLVLESANGNQIRLQPGSRFKINVVSKEGENYSLLLGQAFFKVSRALNFFNVNYQSFLAIVRGTEFEMTVEPQKEIRFKLVAGQLSVQRKVKVKILEGDKAAQLTATDILAQGKKMQVSYRLGVEEYLKEFKTFRYAEDYFRRQLEADEKIGQYERTQQGLEELGHILVAIGKPREALGYFERALKTARERQDQTWEASLLNNLGVAYGDLGEYRKAIVYYEKSLAIEFKLYPDGVHPDISQCYNNLGSAYWGLGEYRKAIEYHEKALALKLKIYPGGLHSSIAASYINLGIAYDDLGEYRKAIVYYEKSLAIELKLYPNGVHPGIALNYNNLGAAYYGLNEYQKAIEYFEKALVIRLRFYPDGEHPEIARSYNGLGAAYGGLGEHRKAIEYHKKALVLWLKLYPDGVHPDILHSYRNLSITYRAAGELARAAEYSKKADEVEAKLKGR